jgi:hypothetical protein
VAAGSAGGSAADSARVGLVGERRGGDQQDADRPATQPSDDRKAPPRVAATAKARIDRSWAQQPGPQRLVNQINRHGPSQANDHPE